MAIGSVDKGNSGGSAYTLGGKPLGVQLGGKSASEAFVGGKSAQSLFAIKSQSISAGGVQVAPNQMLIKGIQDEIDRTLGYRTNLSIAEKQKLADLQGEITKLNEAAQSRSLTEEELNERGDFYVEAYSILGKDYVDVASDEFLQEKTDELRTLMERKPKGADAKRLERLIVMRERFADRVDELGPSGADIYYRQMRNIAKQIRTLTEPRSIKDLSRDEVRAHDEIAEEINKYAGQELQITSEKRLKILRLQKSIEMIQSGGVNTFA